MRRPTMGTFPGNGGFALVVWSVLPFVCPSVATANETLSKEIRNDEIPAENFDEYEGAILFETEVHGYRLLPTDETTGFAETIKVEENSRNVTSVSEVLSKSVGVQVRSLGGLGSYGAASIRGSTSSQVPVFLDGIQLNSGGFPSVDIGSLNLDILAEMEVYRGSTPASLGSGGVGGALSLKARRFTTPVTEASLSYGSYTTGRALLLHGSEKDNLKLFVLISGVGSKGDFKYLNQNGTPRVKTDDRIMKRKNNAHHAFSTLLKLSKEYDSGELMLMNDMYLKSQGLPGMGNIPTQTASLGVTRNVTTIRVRHQKKTFSVALQTSYLRIRDVFKDMRNEIGIGHQHIQSAADALGIRIPITAKWNNRHKTELLLSTRFESFHFEEQFTGVESNTKWRFVSDENITHEWQPHRRWLLKVALKTAIHNSRYGGGNGTIATGPAPRGSEDKLFFAPTLGSRLEIVKNLFWRINAGRYFRTPDIAELFGDRGAVVGNPQLKPERGINLDSGFSFIQSHIGPLSFLRMDMSVFSSFVNNLVAYVQNSQNTVRPENVDEARIIGSEFALRLTINELFSFDGNYTFLDARNRSQAPYLHGNRLPGRPTHEAYARMEASAPVASLWTTFWVDADFAGTNYLDQANFKNEAVARLLFGAGIKLNHATTGLTLTIEFKNLLNRIAVKTNDGSLQPLQDFTGFPLPGRTIFATLNWRV